MIGRIAVILAAACICSTSFVAEAMYPLLHTRQVPIDRLFANLQQRLARNTNDFEITYDLARLHSMAYSAEFDSFAVRTNDDRPQFYKPGTDVGVPRRIVPRPADAARSDALRHLTNAISFYDRAILLLKKSTNSSASKEWLVLPLELGRAWCLDQSKDRIAALAAYRKALGLAWAKEVIGEFNFGEWAQGKWNVIKAGGNPFQSTAAGRRYLGDICYSEEIIGYLLKLLDPVKDAKEIADLKDREKILSKMGRMVTPILVPLSEESELSDLVDPNAAVTFDLDGSGLPRQWGWITPKAAWLVYDHDGEGRITSALQMFGNVTFWIFWRDGYAALSSLDDDQDGTLRGSELRGLALWQDKNCNGVSEPGEVRPVSYWGITAISCVGETGPAGILWSPHGVIFADGATRPSYDWIAPSLSPAAQ